MDCKSNAVEMENIVNNEKTCDLLSKWVDS